MIIKTNGQTFPCTNFSEDREKTIFLIEGEVSVLGETVQLINDDGFMLCDHKVSDYLETNLSRGRIVLLHMTTPVEPVPDMKSIKGGKCADLSQTCNNTITAGCNVTLSDSTKGHISMTEEDQINLLSAMKKIELGATGAPYHLDGGSLCKIYSADDIKIMISAAEKHKLYHTTYFNHLKFWINRMTEIEEVSAITYGSALPEDLAKNMAEVLAYGK